MKYIISVRQGSRAHLNPVAHIPLATSGHAGPSKVCEFVVTGGVDALALGFDGDGSGVLRTLAWLSV